MLLTGWHAVTRPTVGVICLVALLPTLPLIQKPKKGFERNETPHVKILTILRLLVPPPPQHTHDRAAIGGRIRRGCLRSRPRATCSPAMQCYAMQVTVRFPGMLKESFACALSLISLSCRCSSTFPPFLRGLTVARTPGAEGTLSSGSAQESAFQGRPPPEDREKGQKKNGQNEHCRRPRRCDANGRCGYGTRPGLVSGCGLCCVGLGWGEGRCMASILVSIMGSQDVFVSRF